MKYNNLIKYNDAYVHLDFANDDLDGYLCTDVKDKNYVFVDVPVNDNVIGTDYVEVKINVRKIKDLKEVD